MDDVKTPATWPAPRFRPASQADFSKYAKSVSWLAEISLQQAQEVLSRIYGYEHLHELQQELKRPGEAGPFWNEGPEGGGDASTELDLLCGLPGERDLRAAAVLRDWRIKTTGEPDAEAELRDSLIVELGLTDSAESHRACVKRVRALLEDEESSLDERGFPCGFWAWLARMGWDRIPRIHDSISAIRKVDGPGRLWEYEGQPLEHLDQQRYVARDRSVDALIEFEDEIEVEEPNVEGEFGYYEAPGYWSTMWEALRDVWSRRDRDTWEQNCVSHVFAGRLVWSNNEQYLAMHHFVRWPSAKNWRGCGVDVKLEVALEAVAAWRWAWMKDCCHQWRGQQPEVLQLRGQTFDETKREWTSERGQLDALLQKRNLYENISLELYELVGTMSLPSPDNSKWTAVACVQGWHLVPSKDGYYADDDVVEQFLFEHEYLSLGWKVAQRYRTIRGLENMKDWANSDEGAGIAFVKVVMSPAFNTDVWIGRVCRLVVDSLNEEGRSYLTCVDSFWKDDLSPSRADDLDQDDRMVIGGAGFVVASVPGVRGTGLLIADEDGKGVQILVSGTEEAESRLGRRSRYLEGETSPRSRARAILREIQGATADAGVFDADAAVGDGD